MVQAKSNKNKQAKQAAKQEQQPTGKKNIQERSTQSNKKRQNAEQKNGCSSCKWLLGSIFLIALIGGALTYDTQVNGKGVFEHSVTGKMLKNAGMLPYVETAWYTSMSAAARGYKWAEHNVPPYAKPLWQLSCDLSKMARNAACSIYHLAADFISSKLPVVAEFLEQYLPGLPKKIGDTAVAVKKVSVDLFAKTVSFVRTQVLVGRFSTENIYATLNSTQHLALEYYNSFHKKVDLYAKLK